MATTQTRNTKAKAKRPVSGIKAAAAVAPVRKMKSVSILGERLMLNDAGKFVFEATGEIFSVARLRKEWTKLGQFIDQNSVTH